MRYQKKGQIASGAVSNIITLIVGVGVAVLVLIFVGSLGGQTYELVEDDLNDIGLTNYVENFTAINNTATTLTYSVDSGFSAINGTGGNTLASSGYTVSGTTFTLTDATFNQTNINVSYIYQNGTISGSIKNSIVSGFEALEQTGDYLPIIVLAVVISLVLMLVLSFTNFGAMGGDKGSAL